MAIRCIHCGSWKEGECQVCGAIGKVGRKGQWVTIYLQIEDRPAWAFGVMFGRGGFLIQLGPVAYGRFWPKSGPS